MKNNQQVTKLNILKDKKVGTSETIRVLTNKNLTKKQSEYLAGVLDGDGNFEIRYKNNKKILKSIRIVQSIGDSRVLYRVKTLLNGGSIRIKNKNCLIYTISTKDLMICCLKNINGNIRIKLPGYIEACKYFGLQYIEAITPIPAGSNYLAGLIDTNGSIIYNHLTNRIEVLLEFKQNLYTENLDFSQVIQGTKPSIYKLIKRNQSFNKTFFSIKYIYNLVGDSYLIYNYCKKNRLYSELKFYRIMKTPYFYKIRSYKNYQKDSKEFKLYNNFLIK